MSNPVLRLDTSYLDRRDRTEGISSPGVTATTTRSRARSLSQSVLPPFRASSSPNADQDATTFTASTASTASQGASKARNESRKLLAHLLAQLQNRHMPPSFLDSLHTSANRNEKGLGAIVQSVKGAVKHKASKSEGGSYRPVSQDDNASEEEEEAPFSTDVTLDLMNQLRDVLLISIVRDWDIFYDASSQFESKRHSDRTSEFFRSRRGGQVSGRRSRSRSISMTTESQGVVRAPHLLSQCIAVLSSVISEDCRFRTSSSRPSRPPNSLQAVTLDVAQFLVHTHRHDPHLLSQIASAVFPAFYTFSTIMHTRLLTFFDEGVIGSALEDLRRLQGGPNNGPDSPSADDTVELNPPPMVSILVDEVEDANSYPQSDTQWRRWSKSGRTVDGGLHSTNAPAQDVAVYQLSSLITPLLAAILENVDLSSDKLPMLHRFHRLLGRITEYKSDTYLDVLSVIAYHTPRARHTAISLLMSYWPRAIGHFVVSKALPSITYSASVTRATQVSTHVRRPQDNPYAHQFVPWRFGPKSIPSLFEGSAQDECRSCSNPINGFGLLCPFCMCAVHFDCYDYPEGSAFTQYAVASEPDIQKIAIYRFCHVLPHRRGSLPAPVSKQQHTFRLVNLFSLTLCFICRKPLWGCVMQALRCTSCKQFVHSSCLESPQSPIPRCRLMVVDDTSLTLGWSIMRRSFSDHYGDIFIREEDLSHRTYEEISVFFAVLWTQLQILNNGIALGSIVVSQEDSPADDVQVKDFELHQLVDRYGTCLSSGKFSPSSALNDHLLDNHMRAPEVVMFYNWNILAFMAGILKMPGGNSSTTSSASADLLSVAQPDPFSSTQTDDVSYPYEVVSLAHLRDQLGDQFQMLSEPAAKHMLTHLFHLGFFKRLDPELSLFDQTPDLVRQRCCFPLPFGLEESMEVETLVSAIEACLSDLDLSINEAGFLLLVRRFWPDGMLTDYALRRLSKAVILWILSEDNNLAIILRDFVAKGRSLPGVRPSLEMQSWPPPPQSRPTIAGSANNGGDYVASRRSLSSRYASRWMLSLHDLDIDGYATMSFQLLTELAEDGEMSDEYFLGKETDERQLKKQLRVADKILRLIIKLNQTSVLFTTFDNIFRMWLEQADNLSFDDEPIPSLSRLFNRELETSQRLTSIIQDARLTVADASNLANMNTMRVITDVATGSREGFHQTLHWLCLFVRSGVDISVATFIQLSSLAKRFNATFDECSLLIKATLWSAWLRSVGRQELQAMITAIHAHLSEHVLRSLRSKSELSKIVSFIRRSLAVCLLVYGCERGYIVGLGMIEDDDTRGLPSRRKVHSRSVTLMDPIIVHPGLMDVLKSYVELEVDEVSCLTAKFLNAFVNNAPFVESYEVDNFILRNGATLCTCMWQFYAIQLPGISTTRTALLLRVLVVDPQPFETLLHELFQANNHWEVHLQAVSRLFRIILDVTSPAFKVEDRQWKSSVIGVFHSFFSSMWTIEREEVRVAVDTWCQTLLPAHLDAITSCWNESLAKSPIAERIRLVSFLNQLHPHFPSWQVLSWDHIIETLLENDFMQRNGDDEDGPAAAHLSMYGLSSETEDRRVYLDPELGLLRVSLLSLALRMISNGINIDIIAILRIKDHVVRVLGFRDVFVVPTTSGRSFHVRFSGLDDIPEPADACVNDLLLLFDSSKAYDVPPSAIGGPYAEDETPHPLLVGSVFVDVLLDLIIHVKAITRLPFITLKNMLRSLIIVIHKHDFDSKPLRHLQGNLRKATRRTLDILLADTSYELRQLVLSMSQAFIKRWPGIIGNFLIEAIEAAANVMVNLNYEQNGEDVLVDQAKKFLESTLATFASHGVFNLLCKRKLPSDFFFVIRRIVLATAKPSKNFPTQDNLGNALLQDTLMRSVENEMGSYQTVIENVCTYVDVVHHTDLSSDMMQYVGLWFTNIVRRTADWPSDAFDPNPLLMLACTLIQHNKAQSRDLLSYTEILLRDFNTVPEGHSFCIQSRCNASQPIFCCNARTLNRWPGWKGTPLRCNSHGTIGDYELDSREQGR
ncbi:hypothetical protein AcW1_005746 [Taiwanofungus camphoratus]|nr:hypothetical protein AcW2_004509 [Antrodia cinnamomea]KAI0934119.1 hypothetical protein AcV5_006072 [Antrodia cinnamomea]KAI0957314.1 hypothetical protein AcW1_005746 [Antrodia cinnamomea]